MILNLLKIENLKIYAIISAVVFGIWFYKDYQYQKKENIRQTKNISQIRMMDSLKYASQSYTKKELQEYLEYSRKDLKKFLEDNKIRTNRIEKIITQKLEYLDKETRRTDLSPILKAIKENKNISIPVKDSTKCLVVEGWVKFENDSLKLELDSRKFKNKSDVVSYWERKKWKFLGIKTRLFGKKQATVIIRDECGKSETFIIQKNKK
ncbi:hypothetical protein [Olleya marilimosa]|mgnify:CR=1 FL=1|uniref:hypothetical protein n=1 Tax=Olleya marilimosa TaxID=272164 RepID=UPI0030EBE091|tara:strand:+ start:2444 stop:3067 length:624 start_codon:yes stop_codon:yes gene_type:complete